MTIGRIVKAELKKAFPHVKFSVTSDYNSVRVNWTNGVTEKMVDEITSKYEAGKFDGMTDLYEYTNNRHDVPQVNYVFLTRTISEDIYQEKFIDYKNYYNVWKDLTGLDDGSAHIQGCTTRGFIRIQLSGVCL